MNKSTLTNYLFALFALFVIFADEMFLSFLSFTGTSLESGMRSKMAIGIALIGYPLMIWDLIQKKYTRQQGRVFFILFVILVLYLITGQLYYPSVHLYWAELLVYGSMCIPACYVGIKIAYGNYEEELVNLLPLFVLIVTIFVGQAALSSSRLGILLDREDSGMFTYQSASYFLGFSYAYSFFYVFFQTKARRTVFAQLLHLLMIIAMMTCLLGCLVGGGRGAFVFVIVITVYLVIRLLNRKGSGNLKYILLMVVFALTALYLVNRFDVFSSVGFMRVQETLTRDEIRKELWEKSISVFKQSPIIGHGLGSVWWTVGFRSHNLFLDLLAESGILGTFVALFFLIKAIVRLVRQSKNNRTIMFILLVLIGSLVNDMFSGYWIASYKMFLAIGFAYSLK